MKHCLTVILAIACFLVTFCSAVFNGIQVTQGQFPYLVYIIINYNGDDSYACGGGIISERYVISAGHCTFGRNYRVILDTLDVNGYSSSKVVEVVGEPQRPIDFGMYNGKATFDYNDVGIFTLARNISEVDNRIQFLAITTNSPPVGTKLTVVGYGQLGTNRGTSKAHYNTITVARDELCIFDDYKPAVSFCTYDTHAWTCPGDSGSPIVFKPEGYNRFVAIGLNSYGHEGECGTKEPDSVMTRLSALTNFIREKTPLAPPRFVSVEFSPNTPAPANNNPGAPSTPVSTNDCWTCPPGSAHWWKYNYAFPPNGDRCQCIEGTGASGAQSPPATGEVVVYQTPAPVTDKTVAPIKNNSNTIKESIVVLIATIIIGMFL
ncbi:trypsin theta [Acrasis kona]|uniref:Trypsin theta n=1 Tax=Acrasis kona TaxID=1008807 RepID=A0AAW2YZJ2_9EUKA